MRCWVALLVLLAAAFSCGGQSARAGNCDSGDECLCEPPTSRVQQRLDLGSYHGIAVLYDWAPESGQRVGVRLICPSAGRCVCAFPADFQIKGVAPESNRYHLAFSGFTPGFENYSTTLISLGATASGRLLVGSPSFLGPNLRAHGRRLSLLAFALRPVRIRPNGSKLDWGLEYWRSRAHVTAPELWTRVIVGVSYFLTLGQNGLGAGGAHFTVDGKGRVALYDVLAPVLIHTSSPRTIDFGLP